MTAAPSASGLATFAALIREAGDAISSLAMLAPARSPTRSDLLEAVALIHRAAGAVGVEGEKAVDPDAVQRLPHASRLKIAHAAWHATALELLGPEGAALASYRLGGSLVAAG